MPDDGKRPQLRATEGWIGARGNARVATKARNVGNFPTLHARQRPDALRLHRGLFRHFEAS